MDQDPKLTTPALRLLVSQGLAGQLSARGVAGGFLLVMKSGHSELPLLAQRGAARVFKRLDTLASFLKDLGIRTATLELDQWDGGDDAEP